MSTFADEELVSLLHHGRIDHCIEESVVLCFLFWCDHFRSVDIIFVVIVEGHQGFDGIPFQHSFGNSGEQSAFEIQSKMLLFFLILSIFFIEGSMTDYYGSGAMSLPFPCLVFSCIFSSMPTAPLMSLACSCLDMAVSSSLLIGPKR